MLILPALPILRFSLVLELEKNMPVSHFPEATIRGGLGYYLRGETCLFKDLPCARCAMQKSCLYALLFDPPKVEHIGLLESKWPIPKPWTMFARYSKGMVDLEITFFGNHLSKLHPFVKALSALGEQGIGAHESRFRICEMSEPISFLLNEIEFPRANHVGVNIYSPMALRQNGSLIRHWDTLVFASTLLRRIYLLSVHQNVEIPKTWDYLLLLDEFKSVISLENLNNETRTRTSTRQRAKLQYNGFSGFVDLQNVSENVCQLLSAGAVIGVGKNTAFGFGQYDLILDKE